MTSKYAFTVLEDNTVELRLAKETLQNLPFIRQPFDPATGEPFATTEEAQTWANQYIAALENPPAPAPVVDEPTDAIS